MARKVIKKKIRKEATGLYISIVCGLIIIITGIVIYSGIKEREEVEKKLEQAINKKSVSVAECSTEENMLLLLSRMVGWREEGKWRKIKGGWTNKAKLRDHLNWWVAYLKENHKLEKYDSWPEEESSMGSLDKYLTIDKLIVELEQIVKNNETKETSAVSERDSARKQKLQVIQEVSQLWESKNAEINAQIESVITTLNRIKGIIDQGESDLQSRVREIKSIAQELSFNTKKEEQDIIGLTQQLVEAQDRLDKIRQKIRLNRETVEVDGEVIFSDFTNGYVYVNLGKKNAVLDGMEFDVFNIEKGGMHMNKGKVKIFKSYDTYCEASVIEGTFDPNVPMKVGDMVSSQIYSRTKSKVFGFAGKPIGRYTQADLTKKIQDFGGTVLEEIVPEINYLIIGEGYAQDKNFDLSKQFGALIIREKELYGILGLTW
ncbi:MAG: hypothetical protein HY811_05360 [Planctomycetes bacterium]|nr:hypothetical protein [Planctomycetota bacterium]